MILFVIFIFIHPPGRNTYASDVNEYGLYHRQPQACIWGVLFAPTHNLTAQNLIFWDSFLKLTQYRE